MKRYAYAGAFALVAIALVAVMAMGAVPIDPVHSMMLATAVLPAVTGEDIEALTKRLGEINDHVKAVGTEFKAKSDAGEKISGDLKEKTDKLLSEQGALREQIEKLKDIPDQIVVLDARAKEIEQKMVRRRGGDDKPDSEKTPGELFIADEKVKAFLAQGSRNRGRVRMDIKTITTVGMPGLIDPQKLSASFLPHRAFTIRDLISPGRTNSNAIQYWQQTGFTNAAAVVSEGVSKPESVITGELVTENVATIAHVVTAAKQVLDDSPMLSSLIDGELRYGLAFAEEEQILLGDGTGVNIHGIVPQATAYSAAFAPESQQRIDTIRLAILQSEIALFPATGVVLNLTDWARIELTKDAEGRYIFAQPQTESSPRLWSRPVVSTPAMTVTKFLVGAFKLGAQIFDREDANVEISTEDGDNFRKNLITIRGEERFALAVRRPEAFVYGTFQATT